MLDSVADFGLGETLKGTNDSGDLINSALVGREYTFPINETVAAALGMSKRSIGTRVTARIVRNTTGGAILPGEIVTLDLASGVDGLGLASAKSSADDRFAYPVDAAIPAAGCADDDLCYVIVRGVAKVKQPAAAASLAPGDYIKAGASGRLAEDATPNADAPLLLGTSLETNAVNDALVFCWIAPAWG